MSLNPKFIIRNPFCQQNVFDKNLKKYLFRNLAKSKDKIVDEANKPEPFGNVYKLDLFKQKVYDFRDAVKLIKESHEPAVADETNSLLNIDVELDMTGAKKVS